MHDVHDSTVNIAHFSFLSRYSFNSGVNIHCDGCVWQLVLNEHDDDDDDQGAHHSQNNELARCRPTLALMVHFSVSTIQCVSRRCASFECYWCCETLSEWSDCWIYNSGCGFLFELLCIRDGSYSIEFEYGIIIDYIDSQKWCFRCFRIF